MNKPHTGTPLMQLIAQKMIIIANRPLYLSIAALVILFLGGMGYMLAEDGAGPITSMWWAIVTASTVGYGDAYPETTFGRGVAAVMIVSMVTVIIPMITASFTSKLIVDRDVFTHEEQEQIKTTLIAIARKLDVDIDQELEDLAQTQEQVAKRQGVDQR